MKIKNQSEFNLYFSKNKALALELIKNPQNILKNIKYLNIISENNIIKGEFNPKIPFIDSINLPFESQIVQENENKVLLSGKELDSAHFLKINSLTELQEQDDIFINIKIDFLIQISTNPSNKGELAFKKIMKETAKKQINKILKNLQSDIQKEIDQMI